jgi:acyl-CoA reductase-like NAD-dependent aldehyde dehydrogenase
MFSRKGTQCLALFGDDAEAVEAMADSSYGLTAAVYTADQDRAVEILRGLDVGTGRDEFVISIQG